MLQSTAELFVEFSDPKKAIALGSNILLNAEHCKMPPCEEIPEFFNPTNQRNTDFFREPAEYEFYRRLCRPTRLVSGLLFFKTMQQASTF